MLVKGGQEATSGLCWCSSRRIVVYLQRKCHQDLSPRPPPPKKKTKKQNKTKQKKQTPPKKKKQNKTNKQKTRTTINESQLWAALQTEMC